MKRIKPDTDVIIVRLADHYEILGCILDKDSRFHLLKDAEKFCNRYKITYQIMTVPEANNYKFV